MLYSVQPCQLHLSLIPPPLQCGYSYFYTPHKKRQTTAHTESAIGGDSHHPRWLWKKEQASGWLAQSVHLLSAERLQEDASRGRDRERERENGGGGGGGRLLFPSHSAINQLEDSQLARRPPPAATSRSSGLPVPLVSINADSCHSRGSQSGRGWGWEGDT